MDVKIVLYMNQLGFLYVVKRCPRRMHEVCVLRHDRHGPGIRSLPGHRWLRIRSAASDFGRCEKSRNVRPCSHVHREL